MYQQPEPGIFDEPEQSPDRRTILLQWIRENKLRVLIGSAACIFLCVTTAIDLTHLEHGEQQHVRVWGPVAMLYENLGYWPAVLLLPALISIALISNYYKLGRKPKSD